MKKIILLILTYLLIAFPCMAFSPAIQAVVSCVKSGSCADTIKDTDSINTSSASNIAKDDTDDYLHYAQKFQAGYSYNATKVTIRISKTETDPSGTLTLNLCSDNSGNPYANGDGNCTAATATISAGDITTGGVIDVTFTLSSAKSISASSYYWIKLSASVLGTSTAYWFVFKDSEASSGLGFKRSANDSSWDATDSDSGGDYDVWACE